MLTTLYTDASFKDGRGGWACWARSSRGRGIRSGPCPEYVKDALTAELCAVYCGVWLICQNWPETEAILVRSDCQAVCVDPRDRTYEHETRERLRRQIVEALGGRRIIFRWVKGHQRGNSVQAYLNRRCDQLAGEHTGRYERRTG